MNKNNNGRLVRTERAYKTLMIIQIDPYDYGFRVGVFFGTIHRKEHKLIKKRIETAYKVRFLTLHKYPIGFGLFRQILGYVDGLRWCIGQIA